MADMHLDGVCVRVADMLRVGIVITEGDDRDFSSDGVNPIGGLA